MSFVTWARFGPLSTWIAGAWKVRRPPVLLISLPRSGSSWVGATLGLSPGALYLREPISQPHLELHKQRGVVFTIRPDALPEGYQRHADRAFLGLPRFRPNVVRFPAQWSLSSRSNRRVVVKEVNPLAIGWLVERFRPKVVYLLRHPAAVAASFARLGWMSSVQSAGDERRFSVARIGLDPALVAPHRTIWGEHVALQALVMQSALAALAGYDRHHVVRYEDLCADPVGQFRRLYDFAELPWQADVAAAIEEQTSVDDHNRFESFSLYRNSKAMAESWRTDVEEAARDDMKSAFLHYGLPHYAGADW